MCEDYPCCGHDVCPDFDDLGNQMNMKCICGVVLALDSKTSLCVHCRVEMDDEYPELDDIEFDDDDMWED